jgi:hypothetical protein
MGLFMDNLRHGDLRVEGNALTLFNGKKLSKSRKSHSLRVLT